MSITKAELKDIQSLNSKKGRKEKKRFIGEGVRVLEEALRYNLLPERVYYAEAALSGRGADLLEEFQKRQVAAADITLKQLQAISAAETSQGLLGVFSTPGGSLRELYRPEFRKVLLCDGLSDPGNLGTLIRSAMAFEFDLVVLTEHTAEPFSPKVVRSSAGAVFGIPVATATVESFLEHVRQRKPVLITADVHGEAGSERLREAVKERAFVLAIGSEARGVSEEIRAASDLLIRIEHSRRVESLNSAIAGSILMKQIHDFLR